MDITKGGPQGSFCCPCVWNLMMTDWLVGWAMKRSAMEVMAAVTGCGDKVGVALARNKRSGVVAYVERVEYL